MRKEADLAYCYSCNVHLCLDCYSPFHTDDDLVERKAFWQKQFQKEHELMVKKKNKNSSAGKTVKTV